MPAPPANPPPSPFEWGKPKRLRELLGGAFDLEFESGVTTRMPSGRKVGCPFYDLVKAVVADFETPEGRSTVQQALRKRFTGANPADVVQGSLEILREVSTILAAKAPGDASAFKVWLTDISRKVAEASSERGGVQVSDAEKVTLAEISKALGTTA